MTSTVWIVDDDRSVRFVLAEALRAAGLQVLEFETGEAALSALAAGTPALVYTDVRMPGMGGLRLLEQLQARAPGVPVVVMSAWTDLSSTAGAFGGGAREFLSKPFDLDHAVAVATRALERGMHALPEDGAAVSAPAEPGSAAGAAATGIGAHRAAAVSRAPPELVGDAPSMRALFRAIGRLARAPLNVLVTGETGTGKELVARALHRHSPRAQGPFIALNTAAVPAELLESELFGHEAGAFTGARERRIGRFEQAHGGTLFLDEIGDMPLALQTRLLRVLAEGQFFRVGGRTLVDVDVRVIAATHQDLDALVAARAFRADLLHRLDVVRLELPPLRQRREDIGTLAQRFLAHSAGALQLPPRRLSRAALEQLQRHPWPGNVRELENLCWRLAALAPGATVRREDLPQALRAADHSAAAAETSRDRPAAPGAGPGDASDEATDWEDALRRWTARQLHAGAGALHAEVLARVERVLLEAAMQHSGGHRQQAAERLGIGRNTLARKLGPRRRPG